MATAAAVRGPWRLVVVHGIFFLSGWAALVYEVAWMGRLGRLFGTTVEAAGAVLAAFFLGLGLGAAVFGRFAPRLRRPLRAYGLLELGVCAAGSLGLLLAEGHEQFYGGFVEVLGAEGAGRAVARLLLAALWIGPAAFFMGGTLPVLGEAVIHRRAELGRRSSLLYAVNTLGAAAGCLVATFVLFPAIGFQATYASAMVLAAVVGLVAIILGRGEARPREEAGRAWEAPAASGPSRGVLALLAAASGFLALALQVLWTRMFAQALPSSIYVFGIVLVVFLVALAVGGGLAWILARRGFTPQPTLGVLLAAAGVFVAGTVPLFLARTDGLQPPAAGQAWGDYIGRVIGDAVLVLLPAVVVLGSVFPYLLRVAQARARGAGRTLGLLSAANTVGAIVGALAAGFLLLGTVGLWTAIRVLAAAYAVLGGLVLVRAGRRWARGVAVLAVGAVGVSFLLPAPVVRVDAGERLLGVWEGPAGTIAVLERRGELKLVHDNVFTLGGTHDARWEAMQAHVPLCLHPAPRRVFFLGLGTGITAGAALEHPVEHVRVAEIVPEVIEAADGYFAEWTNGLFDDPRAEVVAADARHHLRWSHASYDVIVGDLFFPWDAGTANLYTREHFEAVRARLAPGGLFAQWLPCYQLTREEFLGIARTLAEVFPLVTLWRGDFLADRPLLALVGLEQGWRLDGERLADRARSLAGGSGDDLAEAAATIPLHLYAGNLTQAAALWQDARLLTDDLPWLAYTAPRSERRYQGEPSTLLTGERLLALETALQATCPPEEDRCLAGLDDAARRRVRAGLVMRRMAVHLAVFDRAEHARALRDYVRLVPARVRPDLDRWIE